MIFLILENLCEETGQVHYSIAQSNVDYLSDQMYAQVNKENMKKATKKKSISSQVPEPHSPVKQLYAQVEKKGKKKRTSLLHSWKSLLHLWISCMLKGAAVSNALRRVNYHIYLINARKQKLILPQECWSIISAQNKHDLIKIVHLSGTKIRIDSFFVDSIW